MTKLIIITGLTASGKSNLALKIAKDYNGEIISADSVQIYKNLDIGSDKVSNKDLNDIKHHLINIKEFNETYNVGEFIADTKKAIDTIINKGKLPIIVGGTGMYVKALLEGYTLGDTSADDELRSKYQKMAESQGNVAVWEELNKLNPDRAKTVHHNNLKRVIRYIEIETNNKQITKVDSILKDYSVCALGVVRNREEIYADINKRVDKMIAQGLEDEIKGLIAQGATQNMQSMNTIGYKEWFAYFVDQQSKQETIDLIKQHTRNYCKRQLTFLKTIKNLPLLTIEDAEEKIRSFLND